MPKSKANKVTEAFNEAVETLEEMSNNTAVGVLLQHPTNPELYLGFKRAKSEKQGVSFPCGKKEKDEDTEDAGKRECLEETGYSVSIPNAFPYNTPFSSFEAKDKFIVMIYLAKLEEVERQDPKTKDEGECVWAKKEEFFSGPYGEFNEKAFNYFDSLFQVYKHIANSTPITI